ncbi:hypothetical protein [Streptomyces sp. D54]|uniref:hypothetical protein n=1 Tax=Streptomyces sp. D54 TaxID=1290289 RepID=UPI003CED0DBB
MPARQNEALDLTQTENGSGYAGRFTVSAPARPPARHGSGAAPHAASTARRAGGLAFLHLDDKLETSAPEAVAAQVESAVHALFDASPAMSRAAAAPVGDQGVSGES